MYNRIIYPTDNSYAKAGREYTSLGRNGRCWTTGINITSSAVYDRVTLEPLTSQYKPQRCEIQLPPEAMTELAVSWLNSLPDDQKQAAMLALGATLVNPGNPATAEQLDPTDGSDLYQVVMYSSVYGHETFGPYVGTEEAEAAIVRLKAACERINDGIERTYSLDCLNAQAYGLTLVDVDTIIDQQVEFCEVLPS